MGVRPFGSDLLPTLGFLSRDTGLPAVHLPGGLGGASNWVGWEEFEMLDLFGI